MSLTVIVISIGAAVAASMGYLVNRRLRVKVELIKPGDVAGQKKTVAALPAPKPLEGFPLELGDVVSSGGQERWLSGAIAAREQSVVMVLFFAPEGREHWVVVTHPLPERDILWLRPVEVVSPPEPPATLEIGGFTMQRKSRLPVKFERIGQGAPDVGSTGIVAMYSAGAGEVAVVLTNGEKCLAWSGQRIEASDYERMGKSLEE
jgi:hypothetical protein